MEPGVKQFFKIRDKKTGLFSGGGTNPHWSKRGKTWTSKQALSAHIGLAVHGNGVYGGRWGCKNPSMSDLELVCYEIQESEASATPLSVIADDYLDRREVRETQSAIAAKRRRLVEIEAEAARLKGEASRLQSQL